MEHTVQAAGSRKGKGGPKTAEGKARSALNAVTHGLTARAPVALWFETEEAWTTFRVGIVTSLAPVGDSERDLAEKIALTLWRQNRVAAYETHRTNLALGAAPGEVERSLRPDHTEADVQAKFLAKLTERLLLGDLELLKLQRYESHLGRELSRLFKHLHQLQDRRRAEHREIAPGGAPPPSPAGGGVSASSLRSTSAAPAVAASLPHTEAQSPQQPSEAPTGPVHESVQPATLSRMSSKPVLQNELIPRTTGASRHPFRADPSTTTPHSACPDSRPHVRKWPASQQPTSELNSRATQACPYVVIQ